MAAPIELLDTVALKEDAPEHGLPAGEVGAVVDVYGVNEAFEVEFVDNDGTTYGLHTFRADQLVPLRTRGRALRFRGDTA